MRIVWSTVRLKVERNLFQKKPSTSIWKEDADESNPYLVSKTHLRGYSFDEITEQCDFIDTFYLLFLGDLPDKNQKQLLQLLLTTFISPSPRHPASRSAMSLGGGKNLSSAHSSYITRYCRR